MRLTIKYRFSSPWFKPGAVAGMFMMMLLNSSALAQEINIIPQPVEIKKGADFFPIDKKIEIAYDAKTENTAKFLADYFKSYYNIKCTLTSDMHKEKAILLMSGSVDKVGMYKLDVDKSGISIAGDESGVFYGVQTLIQLLPIQIPNSKIQIPFVSITDYPRFAYRGLHLDVSRHFFPVSFIKKYIDYIALHKMNYFHWHLTEDQGWRIEIKKYPKLTQVGAWRNGTIIGRYPGTGNDNIRYGGFYTQAEIKEVVQYAKDRFIEVIPEIEMPGHSSAAIAAYPLLSCFPGKPTPIPANMISQNSVEEQKKGKIKLVQETWGIFDDVYCAGNDSTFMFLQNVIDEVIALFPSKFFHIGGDECPKTHWKKCPRCQQRMKDNNLKDEHELQSYFVQRIEKYLNSKERSLIGWDEILEGGLAPNAVVMSWRGEKGGIEAGKQGHYVIMTPGNPVYFDHTQTENEDSVVFGGYNPIDKVYAYEPIPKELKNDEAKYVLGAQANVWTEYMMNPKKVEYMLFPRLSALSEVLWSPKEKKNWSDFEKRLIIQFKRYDLWNANYSKAYFDLKVTVLPTEDYKGVLWKLESKSKNSGIQYNKELSQTDPPNPPAFYSYTSPILITKSGTYHSWSTENGKRLNNIITQKFSFNKATGKKITLKEDASKNYPGDGAFTLVNGVVNTKGFSRTREFLGFSGTDCEAVIDLGSLQSISFVVVNALTRRTSWIYEPSSAEVFGSGDGQTWYSLKQTNDFMETKEGNGKGTMTMAFRATYARYVKVVVKNWGSIPDGNAGAGNKSWLFVDEISVDGPDASGRW